MRTMKVLGPGVVFAAWLCLCGSLRAESLFDSVDIVPAKGIRLDGNLADWNQKALVETYFDEMLSPLYSMSIGFAYDRDALYIGAHFADESPMVNAVTATDSPDGGRGDCLQVHLATDPKAGLPENSDRICHLAIWSSSTAKQPVLTIRYGMDLHAKRVLVGANSGFVFVKDRDGKGYALEGRIPWALLNTGKEGFRPGDKMPISFQAIWGDETGATPVAVLSEIRKNRDLWTSRGSWGTGIFSDTGDVAKRVSRRVAESANPIVTKVKIPDGEAVSISGAVFSAGKGLVRTLDPIIRTRDEKGDEVEFQWDGADDQGVPLPEGDYTLKVLTHRGIGQKFVASINTSGNPPWQSDDGKGAWGGDQSPAAAAMAANGRVFLGWPYAEGSVRLVCVDERGIAKGEPPSVVFRSNSGANSGGFPCALVVQGSDMFVGYDCISKGTDEVTCAIRMTDAGTGQAVDFPFGKKEIVLGEWKPEAKAADDKALFERRKTGDLGPLQFYGGRINSFNFLGLAAKGDLLAASVGRQDKVILYNWKTGEKVSEFSVKTPAGLQFAKDGTLVVASGNDLVRVDPHTGKMTMLAAGVLDNPWGLALDAKGNIYVANCGKTMAVRVFDAAGKLLRTVGKEGGRPWEGTFEQDGMLMPAGITVDGEDKLWVTEWDPCPKRVSVWDKEGRFVADYLGPNHPQKSQDAVPWEPELINVSNAEFSLDYDTGKWKCLSTLYRPCLTGISPNFGMCAWNAEQQSYIFRKHDGKEYAIATSFGMNYGTIFRRDGTRLKPIASLGNTLGLPLIMQGGSALGEYELDPVDFLTPEQYAAFYDPVNRKAKVHWEVWHDWVDHNGDGLIQKDEYNVESLPFGEFGLTRVKFVDDDMTLWVQSHKKGIIPVPVESWTADGIPIYPKPKDWKPLFSKVTSTGDEPLLVDNKRKRVYSTDNEGATAIARGKWQAYSCYDFDGNCLWMYRPVWLTFGRDAPLWRPGLLIGANTFTGLAEVNDKLDVIGICGYYGNYYLLSSDGLWVSQLCYDDRLGPRPGPNVQFIENFTGSLFKNPKNGKIYLLGGDVDCRVWEVTGLDTIKAAELPLKISAGDYQLASAAALKRSEKKEEKAAAFSLVAAPRLTLDGDLAEWNMEQGAVAVDAGAGRSWKAKVAYDDKNLYVAFKVTDPSPLLNAGSDAPLFFKTGDACDLTLSTDPNADPKRTKPAAGDLRLLFGLMGDKAVCEVFDAVNKAGDPGKAFEFKSPTGQEHFDRVEVLNDAKVVTKKTADGYLLEAAVPLLSIGFAPKPGMSLRGDLGVLFSAEGGGRTILRSYYSNKETGTIEDIPSESRLYPDKWTEVKVR